MSQSDTPRSRPRIQRHPELDDCPVCDELRAELAAEREAHAETKRIAQAWHGAVDTAATIMELPNGLPTPGQFLRDVQEFDRAKRDAEQLAAQLMEHGRTAIDSGEQIIATLRAEREHERSARERAEAALTGSSKALYDAYHLATQRAERAEARIAAAIDAAMKETP